MGRLAWRQAGWTGLGAGGGSRCKNPGKTWLMAVAELIFDFVCLSPVRREKPQLAR